ncbi:hypothetical protein GGF50DRAFT_131906 [Schizophyllum commune]
MNYSLQKAARAAAHIPPDADIVCKCTVFRLLYLIKWYNAPLKLLIDLDQLGNYVLPSNSFTYEEKGAKQVDVVAKDEKHTYTLVQVWSGKMSRVLPTDQADDMDMLELSHIMLSLSLVFDCHLCGLLFVFALLPRSHYSMQKTMKEWLDHILIPYFESKFILLLDVYPIHTSAEFRAVLRSVVLADIS